MPGNSSQVSDGAAAVLLASRAAARRRGLPVVGTIRAYEVLFLTFRNSADAKVIGVAPDIMGIGPAVAIPIAVQKAGCVLHVCF
jgi:acetyl-CoA acetyltransferase